MKIMGRVSKRAEKIQLQFNFDILVSWSEKWQLKFIVDKCKVLHIWNNNQYTKYAKICPNFPMLAIEIRGNY